MAGGERGAHCGLVKVLRGGYPLKRMSKPFDRVCEALDVARAVVEEEEAHGELRTKSREDQKLTSVRSHWPLITPFSDST